MRIVFLPSRSLLIRHRIVSVTFLCLVLALCTSIAQAQTATAYVRVNQAGYEASSTPIRAYLMSTTAETDATFQVMDRSGAVRYSGPIGILLGTWGHSKTLTYDVYALDFTVPSGHTYTISVAGPVAATSPRFAVDRPEVLYPGFLVNTLFFYETERDGPNYIPNALRTAPGHLKDEDAERYITPPIDANGYIDNVPPALPLTATQLPNINAAGGWWDAGDYEKYVEDESYATALMEIGVRDFPNQMGRNAPEHPAAPPVSVSYAGNSGPGSPASSDFTDEASFGVNWLLKMWDAPTKTLSYQVDNSQDWDYYGEGDPASSGGYCGGTYASPYCLITEYDIWTLPQAADNFDQPGDAGPCDPLTTFYICNRPVFTALPGGARISPNLAGRLAADFAVCYQLNRTTDPDHAKRCLKTAEDIFALADTTFPDPAPAPGSGSCSNCLLTTVPAGYETVWDDDMELGATELYFALQSAGGAENLPQGLPTTDPMQYLQLATQYAQNYITKIYKPGYADTLNLYDVSGLAHYELYRAIAQAGNPPGLAISQSAIRKQLLDQVDAAIAQAKTDAWGFGEAWGDGDITSHGAGLSVMASEAYALTQEKRYDTYAQRWLGNILGANSWGSSFIVGDGTTFPNCIQHQVANIAGALDGTSGGTPILWGASSEGPSNAASSGFLQGMHRCPQNRINTFKIFNGNDGPFDRSQIAVYKDNVQSYTTTEPAIDLTSTSFLMWSWRLAEGQDQ
ncbi:MAG TPA: glycoside hydrolase family 9 protein [Acidobacteriaceae bacterium]|nr:glycoside hydrolase family 9 protein [Acidobacteriaceae bacterium]